MKIQVEVRGVKRYKGQPESGGPSYNQTKLVCLFDAPHSQVPSPDQDGSASAGENVSEVVCGDVSKYTELAVIQYPAIFEVDLNITTKGYEIASYKFIKSFPKAVS